MVAVAENRMRMLGFLARRELPALSLNLLTKINEEGRKLGCFDPFKHNTLGLFTFFSHSEEIIPCIVKKIEGSDGRVYMLKLSTSELFFYFSTGKRDNDLQFLDDNRHEDYWSVGIYDLTSSATGKGYGSMLFGLADTVLSTMTNHNNTPIYAYMEDGSKTEWTTAIAKEYGFVAGAKSWELTKRGLRIVKPLYKWYMPEI